MAKVDSSKLLPTSKSSSAMVLYRRPNLTAAIKPIQFKTGSAIVKGDDKKESKDVNNKLVQVEKFFKSELLASKRGAETKREDKESDDFKKAEDKLETPKSRQFQLPSISASLPKLGFLDRIKRFIFFTAIGWLFPKLLEFMPKLRVLGNIISTVQKFAVKIFTGLFDGFVSLVKFGGDLKEKTLGFISTIPGANNPTFQSTFKSLQDNFDTFVNAAIISSVLAGDIGLTIADELGKLKRERAAISAAKQGGQAVATTVAARGATSAARSYSAGKSLTTGTTGATRTASNFQLNRQRQQLTRQTSTTPPTKKPWWQRIVPQFKTPPWIEKILTKFKSGPLKKLAGPFSKFLGKAIPFAGAVISEVDARQRFARGEVVGGWLARIGGILDGFAAGAAIAGLPFVASIIGAPIGGIIEIVAGVATALSIGIDVILLIHDILGAFGVKTFSRGGRVIGKYQGGGVSRGTPTRGGRRVDAPIKRGFTPQTRRSVRFTPPKPKKSQPGKDVGGTKKIQRLYPDPTSQESNTYAWLTSDLGGNQSQYQAQQEERANPYKVITTAAKLTKEIPFIGGIMGAAIDLALGEKPTQQTLKSLTMGIGYLVDSLANQKMNMTLGSLSTEIRKFNEGGIVGSKEIAKIYDSLSRGDLLYKIIGPILTQKSNQIIKEITKEIEKRFAIGDQLPGIGDPLGGGGGPEVSSIDMTGFSPQDIDALGRMVFAESRGENNIGKAAVLNAILNRYRLAKSGRGYLPQGKTKDNVTLMDLFSAPNQFAPYRDGEFQRATPEAGQSALAQAIAAGGNDPQKLKQNLIAAGLSEADANYVILSTAFYNPKESKNTPFRGMREVAVGNHNFQESSEPSARLRSPGAAVQSTVVFTTNFSGGQVGTNPFQLLGGSQDPKQPGIDFTLGGTQNRAIFAGVVREIKHQYNPNAIGGDGRRGAGYGNYIVIRSINPIDGTPVDMLYAHFPDGEIKVNVGDQVAVGQNLGRMATAAEFANPRTRSRVGSGTGPHTSLDFYSPSSNSAHPQARAIGNYILRELGKGSSGNIEKERRRALQQQQQQQETAQSLLQMPQSPQELQRRREQEVYAKLRNQKLEFKSNGKNYYFTVDGSGNVSVYEKPSSFLGFTMGGPRKLSERELESVSLRNAIIRKGRSYYTQFHPKFPLTDDGITELMYADPTNKKSGGLIQPTNSRLSIPNSYASYENSYGGEEPIIALQPILIPKQMPSPSSSKGELIMFPVPVVVNTNMDTAYNRSRGY